MRCSPVVCGGPLQVQSKDQQVHMTFQRRRNQQAGRAALNSTTYGSRPALGAAAAHVPPFRTPHPVSGRRLEGPASFTPAPGQQLQAPAAIPPAGAAQAAAAGSMPPPWQASTQQQQHWEQAQQERQRVFRPGSSGTPAAAGGGGRPSPLLAARDALDGVSPVVTEAGEKKLQTIDGTAAMLQRRSSASMDRWKQVSGSLVCCKLPTFCAGFADVHCVGWVWHVVCTTEVCLL